MTAIDAPRGRLFGLTLDRWGAVALAGLGLCAALVAALLMRIVTEAGGVNSYALLADAFLHGRFDSPTCFDSDCARLPDGRIFVIFPPVPALVAAPLVALMGPGATGFVVITALLALVTGWSWWSIAGRLGLGREARVWATAAFMFGAPAIFVTLRGDNVWFFAQAVGLALVSLAILSALDRRLLLAGALIGLAFLSRQMALFLTPFLFALSRPKGAKLIAFDRQTIFDALKLGAPVLAAIGVYCLYNWVRFGAPLDTGYAYIAAYPSVEERNFITWRVLDKGLFNREYFISNVAYMFLQGFHMEFSGKYMTVLGGMDPMGTSILAASPFVLYAIYAKADAKLLIGALVIAIVGGITLFYHSNGFSQQNVQRYALDWLPVLYVILMAGAFTGDPEKVAERLKIFKLLAVYAVGLNVAAFAVAALSKGVV